MKNLSGKVLVVFGMMMVTISATAQDGDTTAVAEEKPGKDNRPVKDAFESNWLINSQTPVVSFANTLEFDINHRFGAFRNGVKDMFGLYAPSNIRLGLSYTPVKNLQLGAGMTKEAMMYDFNLKWNPLQQTRSGSFPVFITYTAGMVIEGTENTVNWSIKDINGNDSLVNKRFPEYANRFSYFHQIIIGRKFCNWFSFQIAPAYMHYNLIDTVTNKNIKHDNISISAAGRIKFSGQMSAIFEYTFPFTPAENVKPGASLGIEVSTGSHAFQIFFSTFSSIISQRDIVYNKNDYNLIGDFALGFNVTRLWNF